MTWQAGKETDPDRCKLGETTKIGTPPQLSDRLHFGTLVAEMKELREKVFEARGRPAHPECLISSCIWHLEKFAALYGVRDKRKRNLRWYLADGLERFCFGYQQASIMHYIFRKYDPISLLKKSNIFVSGRLPTTSLPVEGSTASSDALFEKFTECVLMDAGCKVLKRDMIGERKNVDLVVQHNGHNFAIECKRPKTRNGIERLMRCARKQLDEVHRKTGFTRVISLDLSMPVIHAIKEVVDAPRPPSEFTEAQIWKPIGKIFHGDMSKETPNRYINALGITMVPYVSSKLTPTIAFQVLAARNCEDTPGSDIDQLYNSVGAIKGLYK